MADIPISKMVVPGSNDVLVLKDSSAANKVSSPTSGNLAGLDALGNLTDAGWASDKTTTSATGNPISISGLKSNQLAINPVITLEPIQAGSGDPSPSNVRAISGYDKIEVLSCGKNLLPLSISEIKAANDNIAWNGNTTTTPEGITITLNGSNDTVESIKVTGSVTGFPYSVFILSTPSHNSMCSIFKPSHTYTASSAIRPTDNMTQGYAGTFTVDSDWHIDNAYVYMIFGQGTTYDNIYYPQIEEGSTATTFETPNINEVKLTLGQTIYGGTLDVEKGILTVDRAGVDLGDLTYTYNLGGKGEFGALLSDSKASVSDVCNPNAYCSIYEVTPYGYSNPNRQDYSIGVYDRSYVNERLTIKDSRYIDAASLKAALAGQKLVYELAEPYTIQLTPHEISLLKDYAYVSTNGTNMSFSYHNGEIATLGDVAQLGETVNELGSGLNTYITKNAFGQLVNIATYNTESNIFTFPTDGYLYIRCNASGSKIFVVVMGLADANVGVYIELEYGTQASSTSLYVKKGMRTYVYSGTGNYSYGFVPLV